MKREIDGKMHSTIDLLAVLLVFTAMIPYTASSENAYTIKGDLLVTTLKGYNDGAYKLCGKLPWEFQYALQTHAGYELTDTDFVALVGDTTGFGIRGAVDLYSREQREVVLWTSLNDLVKTHKTSEYDDYPIVCGATEEARAESAGTPLDTNSAEFQYSKGLAYTNGDGVARDTVLAREWLGKAAEQGHDVAQATLGMLYQLGNGGQRDFYLAQLWYLKAAQQGNADAQANLGGMYWNGDGVQVDHEQAFAWFSMAARQEQANASNFIANVRSKLDAAAVERSLALANSYEDPATISAMIKRLSAPDRSLYSQCLVNEVNSGNPRLKKWCSCLSDGFEAVLRPSDFRQYGQDYAAFRAKLMDDPNNGGSWTFTNVLNSCRSCQDSDYIGCLKEDLEPPGRKSFARTLNLLRTRNFDSIPTNRVYRQFFLEYISAYSNQCGDMIGSGTRFANRFVRRDGMDVTTTESETLVETGYITSFNNYEWYAEREYVGELAAAMRSDASREAYAENAFGAAAVLDEHFSNSCSSDAIQSVYRALYDFERFGDDEMSSGNIE